MKAPAPRAPTSAAGATLCLRPTGDGGAGRGDTAPRHTGELSRPVPLSPHGSPSSDPWGPIALLTASGAPRAPEAGAVLAPGPACPPLPVPVPTPLT